MHRSPRLPTKTSDTMGHALYGVEAVGDRRKREPIEPGFEATW